MKRKLIVINVDNAIDLITNSSSELFVLQSSTLDICKEMISNVYPDYLNEYEELKDIQYMENKEIDDFLGWHLGRISNFWSSWEIYDKKDSYVILPGFEFEEIYDTSVTLDRRNNEYKIKNNIPFDQMKNDWDLSFVTNENRNRVIEALEKSVGRFFLYSKDENPNWDMQEKLNNIGSRYHLG